MMKILSIVGARPEFIQAMTVSNAIGADHQEILVHTGQHYDYQMSQLFFDELDIPTPHYNLGAGSGSQARQTAEIMVGLEEFILKEKPDFMLVRGDTNSSLAAALVASKLSIPFAHIEAGERSFNRSMPEEINRILVDRMANIHFCVSHTAQDHLLAEGIIESVHWVGDVMLDALIYAHPKAKAKSTILERLQIKPKNYSLITIHRAANTDDPKRLTQIFDALNSISETIIFPLHPRTKKAINQNNIRPKEHIQMIEPVGYLDMLILEENSRLIATDSGGVQREAYYLSIPCLTLRDETEWTGTIECGWNKLVGADKNIILNHWFNFSPHTEHPPIYGDGNAAIRIAEIINREAVKMIRKNKEDL